MNINVVLFSYTRAFGNGLRNFEPRSSDEDDTCAGTPCPNYNTTPTFELSTDSTCMAHLRGGFLVVLGYLDHWATAAFNYFQTEKLGDSNHRTRKEDYQSVVYVLRLLEHEMGVESVVARVAAIVGDHCCPTPRHRFKETLDVFLEVQQTKQLPYVTKVDLVGQLGE
ncbi:hypothetical protein TNCV_2329941 [Trichonephila clavipes]|nr:hypothetical protein TNCV_2329941 [Trichonephila clavipes]